MSPSAEFNQAQRKKMKPHPALPYLKVGSLSPRKGVQGPLRKVKWPTSLGLRSQWVENPGLQSGLGLQRKGPASPKVTAGPQNLDLSNKHKNFGAWCICPGPGNWKNCLRLTFSRPSLYWPPSGIFWPFFEEDADPVSSSVKEAPALLHPSTGFWAPLGS